MKNRIAPLRAERSWTQADLAQHAGVSRQSINAIETGKFDPSLPLAFRLARLFDTTTEALFNEHPPESLPPKHEKTEHSMIDPATRLGTLQIIASTDASYPDLTGVPTDLAQQLDALQPNWRRIIELLREDADLGASSAD